MEKLATSCIPAAIRATMVGVALSISVGALADGMTDPDRQRVETKNFQEASGMDHFLVRIAEIEVYPEWLEAYLAAAWTVGAESVAKEPGVICIFPMQQKETPNVIRIVEIYRDDAAYKAHLETPHFRAYKEGTPHMIKSLALVPMAPLDPAGMKLIFQKGTGAPLRPNR